jgi:urease accessory protein UreF
LDEALNRLPEGDRQLVVLHYLEGVPHREIADRQGKSTSAIQRQYHRGLDKLARLLRRRNVAVSASGLAALLGVEAAKAMPASLFKTLSGAALAAPGTCSLPFIAKTTILMTAKQKTLLAVASVALIAAVPITL